MSKILDLLRRRLLICPELCLNVISPPNNFKEVMYILGFAAFDEFIRKTKILVGSGLSNKAGLFILIRFGIEGGCFLQETCVL